MAVRPYGIKLVAHGRTGPEIDPPEWVTEFDPDGGDLNIDYPTGWVESDVNPAKALRFPTFADARDCWRKQSTRTPYRPDGAPNRPLTSFTVEIEKLP